MRAIAMTILLAAAVWPAAAAADCTRLAEAARAVAHARYGGVDYSTAMRAAETERQRELVREAFQLPDVDTESAQLRAARWFADDVLDDCLRGRWQ